jgi:hypothetical protein
MSSGLMAVLLTGLVFQAALIKVVRDQSEKENRHRTILAVPATAPFGNAMPELRVECMQQVETKQFLIEETNDFSVSLDAGPLRTAGDVISLSVKLDGNRPANHQCMALPDKMSYRYYAYPGSEPNRDPNLASDARQALEDARIQSDTAKFLEEVFSAKTVSIELQPGGVQVRFEVGGLRQEFDKYPECKAYYRTPH